MYIFSAVKTSFVRKAFCLLDIAVFSDILRREVSPTDKISEKGGVENDIIGI